jgi:hypothetical protein
MEESRPVTLEELRIELEKLQKLGELSQGTLAIGDTQDILARISIACIDKRAWDLNYENDSLYKLLKSKKMIKWE